MIQYQTFEVIQHTGRCENEICIATLHVFQQVTNDVICVGGGAISFQLPHLSESLHF